jgi:hypothetical protein
MFGTPQKAKIAIREMNALAPLKAPLAALF